MRRFYLSLFAAVCAVACTDPLDNIYDTMGHITGHSEIQDVNLGYYTIPPSVGGMSAMRDEYFVPYLDKTAIDKAGDGVEDGYRANVLEYHAPDRVFVNVKPNDAYIRGVKLESDDPSVVTFLPDPEHPLGYYTIPVSVGETEVKLSVKGEKDRVVNRTYPVRVNATTTFKVHVPKFWYSNIFNTRLRYRVKDMPNGIPAMYMDVTDSVTVIGRCEYFNHRLYGSVKQYKLDTMTFPLRRHTERFRKGKRVFLRDVSDAVRKFNSGKEPGTYVQSYTVGGQMRHDTLDCYYSWSTAQIELSLNIVSDNPYLVFTPIVKCKNSSRDSDDNDRSDGDIDDPVDSDDTNDEEALQYFKFSFNDGLTSHQRDSIMKALQKFRDDNNMPELTPAEQDSLLAIRNRKLH